MAKKVGGAPTVGLAGCFQEGLHKFGGRLAHMHGRAREKGAQDRSGRPWGMLRQLLRLARAGRHVNFSARGGLTIGWRHAKHIDMKREKLIKAREAAGMSQDALGTAAGVTKWTINRIEGGERNPSFALMQKIMTALGGSVSADIFIPSSAPPNDEAAA